jgi:flagellar hook-associated protein 3 FlgL
MRIATAHAYDNSIDNLQRRQADMAHAQEQLTSGKRVLHASDDPTAAARAERALATISRSETSQRALEASKTAMSLSEAALGDAGNLLQQARETMVSAGNATYSDAERASLAQQLKSMRDQLLAVANRSDGNGGYVFAGQGGGGPPFVDAAGGVQFQGVAGETQTTGDEPMPLTIDGSAWLRSRSGNGVFDTQALPGTTGAWIDAGHVTDPSQITGSTYTVQFASGAGGTTYSVLKDGAATALANVPFTSGKAIQIDGMAFTVSGSPTASDSFQIAPSSASLSVFDTLDKAIADLQTPNRTAAQIAQTTQSGLRDIDAAMSNLQSMRAAVGQVLNRADGVAGRLDASKLAAQTAQSDAVDLDMTQAISEFQNQQSGYDAALKTYSIVQRMSLFQYLNG